MDDVTAPPTFHVTDLRPVDRPWLADAFGNWRCSYKWSPRGRTPSPQLLDSLLDDGVVVQKVVRDVGGSPLALLQVGVLSEENEHADLDVLVHPSVEADVGSTVADLVAIAFRDLPLRKLCLMALDEELEVVGWRALGAERVGCLHEHERRGRDGHADLLVYEIWADRVR